MLFVIEEDKGDGWTRVRRNEEEEGYVPSSYIEVFLDSNAKGEYYYFFKSFFKSQCVKNNRNILCVRANDLKISKVFLNLF